MDARVWLGLGLLLPTGAPVMAAGEAQAAMAQQRPAEVSVHFGHAGLITVDVEGALLRYTWHTLKEGPKIPVQSLQAYDRHEACRTLSPTQQRWVKGWLEKHRVFRFRPKYPSGDAHSYGAAFVSRLQVRQGERVRSVEWDGTSRAPGPNAAADELVGWARKITRQPR
jgi:hypothetical protein